MRVRHFAGCARFSAGRIGPLAHDPVGKPRARPRSVRLLPHRAQAGSCWAVPRWAQYIPRNGWLHCMVLGSIDCQGIPHGG